LLTPFKGRRANIPEIHMKEGLIELVEKLGKYIQQKNKGRAHKP